VRSDHATRRATEKIAPPAQPCRRGDRVLRKNRPDAENPGRLDADNRRRCRETGQLTRSTDLLRCSTDLFSSATDLLSDETDLLSDSTDLFSGTTDQFNALTDLFTD
jgi:hypothetical protein